MHAKNLTQYPEELIERFIHQTSNLIFLTGKAGTGKTTLVQKLVKESHKNTVVVAPTGIAALHAGGVTIHSFFQLPFAAFVPEMNGEVFNERLRIESRQTLRRHFKMGKKRQQLMRSLELLIIDEVSMLRADLLDAMDWTLRFVRSHSAPFGGVQVLFVGDLMQLPPVVKQEEWNVLQKHYSGMYFFQSSVLSSHPPVYIELKHVYRQQDVYFLEVLNSLRDNAIRPEHLNLLNQYVRTDFKENPDEPIITLTTHNQKANQLNGRKLEEIREPLAKFKAKITGDFPESLYPMPLELELKVGAQVMFIKNDTAIEKRYFNGKIGTVTSLEDGEILVAFPNEGNEIRVDRFEWENVRYHHNPKTQTIDEETIGTFVHYPLRLAWAITVHKSQGLTFDRAILDVTDVFAPGQAYVALSRLRSLDGLVLLRPFVVRNLSNDSEVLRFSGSEQEEEILQQHLLAGTSFYLRQRLISAFDWNTLELKWSALEKSAMAAGPRSTKGKSLKWINVQAQTIHRTLDPARKFRAQIERLLPTGKEIDYAFLDERVQAAYHYFYPVLDHLLVNTLLKIKELSSQLAAKELTEELTELDEELTRVVIEMKKVRVLTEHLFLGRAWGKSSLITEEIKNYKTVKIAEANHKRRQTALFAENENTSAPEGKTKKGLRERNTAVASHDKTLKLLESGITLDGVAEERKLALSTIHTHIELLLREEKIEPEKVMEPEKVAHLKTVFEGGAALSLTAIQQLPGFEGYSINEIKWVRAACLK
jgi:hypothetical protein